MSKSSTDGAARPLVSGRRQENTAQTRQESFFRDAAAWIMKAIDGKPTGKPPAIPETVPGESDDRWIDTCRPSLHRLFERLQERFEDRADDAREKNRDALHECLLVWQFTENVFDSLLSELMRNGFVDRTIAAMIADEADPDEASYGDKNFDGVYAAYMAEIHEARNAKAPAAEVADMADEKAAKATEKPAKAVDTFAKLYDWIGKLEISATARIVMVEIVRNAHGAPFSWVSSKTLEERAQVQKRQIRRILRSLEKAGHITVRPIPYLSTQRLIFVNHEAELAGIDPKSIALPENSDAFWKSFLPRFKRQDKPKSKATTTSKIKAKMTPYRGASYRGSSVTGGEVIHAPRRDKGFSAPIGAEKTHTVGTVSTSPPRGVLPLPPVEVSAEPAPSATPAPKSEHEAAKAKAAKPTRPPMDWPERNLPTVNRESALARMVRLGRITHLHPRWLDGLACWVVRHRTIDGQAVYLPPKSMDDGWIVNTCDTVIVPLIDPENRRISQAKFVELLRAGPIIAPNPNGS